MADSTLQYHIIVALSSPQSDVSGANEPDLADLSAQIDAIALRPPSSIWADLNTSPASPPSHRAPPEVDWSVLDDPKASASPTSDARYGPISIEWRDMASKAADKQIVDLGYGVIHLYRETETYVPPDQINGQPNEPVASTSEVTVEETAHEEAIGEDGTVLAVLAIPSVMSVADFLVFVEPAAESISQIRILRDAIPNRCMAVIKLHSADDALKFREEFNGRPFWAMMDDEICHVVRVRSVEFKTSDGPTFALPFSSGRTQASAGLVELPTCPVCLERMDVNVTGLITILCQHTFHCSCLSKWASGKCPVCRYSQARLKGATSTTPGEPIPTACADCSATSSLWMCLICGHVGCGRYQNRHAFSHFQDSTHIYAMELETQRVWDYASDSYVHRLIQNKTDGKLVELPSLAGQPTADAIEAGHEGTFGPNRAAVLAQEKIEQIGLEYSNLLASQLDSQRAFYQTKLSQLKEEISTYERDKDRMGRKVDKSVDLIKTLQRDLNAEREVSKGLLSNMDKLRSDKAVKEQENWALQGELREAQDQLRDMMFALSARDKIEAEGGALGELAGGDVSMPEPPAAATPSPSRRRKKR